MFTKLSTATLALAAVSMVSAQTSTVCNPLKEDCPADPAFGKNGMNCDFTKGKCDGFESLGTAIKYDSNGAQFTMSKVGDAPTLRSDNYLFFGHVEVVAQAAPGAGIVTSLVLLSDDLDEIDYETVGSDTAHIQSNYFSKGDDSTYNRGGTHPVNNPFGESHTYAFEWTPDQVEWFIDGASVRVLKASDVGDKFPQSPMQVKIGAWVAGYKGNSQGTIDWAGGIADFSNGPHTAIYQSVKVTDYAGGSSATDKDVKEYVYGDRSGSANSIQVKLNDGSSSSSSSSASSGSTTATTATTASSSKTTSSAVASTTDATTMTTATSSANSTASSATASHSSTAAGSSTGSATTPSSVPGAAPRTGFAFGALALGALVALAL